jgi:poly(A) RNA polymerase GLD2
MGTVKPVPPMDLEDLKAKGHHPLFFVKPVGHSIEAMSVIAQCRKEDPFAYEKFDRDIWTYVNSPQNLQSESLVVAKERAIKLTNSVLPKFTNSTLHFCGSTRNGCGLADADVDLCWAIPMRVEVESDVPYPMAEQDHFNPKLYLGLAKKNINELEEIRVNGEAKFVKARVPILNFKMVVQGIDDEMHELQCDLNINNTAGIHNTLLLAHYAKLDERLPALARVLKRWGKRAEIIDSYSGYLNSYTIVLMIIHFLQCGVSPPILPNLNALRPDLFDGNLDLLKLEESYDLDLGIKMERNDTPIGDLLIGFLRYYGFFCYPREGIYIRMGCVGDKYVAIVLYKR